MAFEGDSYDTNEQELQDCKELAKKIPRGILCTVIGCIVVWSCLFGTGWLLYAAGGKTELFARGWTALGVATVATVSLLTLVGRKRKQG